jgi:hypothetical protein
MLVILASVTSMTRRLLNLLTFLPLVACVAVALWSWATDATYFGWGYGGSRLEVRGSLGWQPWERHGGSASLRPRSRPMAVPP